MQQSVTITPALNLSLPIDRENGDIEIIYIPQPDKALINIAYNALKEIKKGIDKDSYSIAVVEYANYAKSDNDKVALENLLEKALLPSKILTQQGVTLDFLEWQKGVSEYDLEYLKGSVALSLALLRYASPAIRQSVSGELCFLGNSMEWIDFAKNQLQDLIQARVMEFCEQIKSDFAELKKENANVDFVEFADSFLAKLSISQDLKQSIKSELIQC